MMAPIKKGQPCFIKDLPGIVGWTTKTHVFVIGDGWGNLFEKGTVSYPKDGKANTTQLTIQEEYHSHSANPRCRDCKLWSSVGTKGKSGRCGVIIAKPRSADHPRIKRVLAFLLPEEPNCSELITLPNFSCSMGVFREKPNGGGHKNSKQRSPRQFTW